MVDKVTPFLMFQGGVAGAAIARYRELIPGAEIKRLDHYGPGEPGPVGQVSRAVLVIAGQELMIIDSPIKHAFDFTPSVSLFVDCADELEIERVFGGLAEGGVVRMPLENYGFSLRFGWVDDRFGVSWQLNLPAS